MRQLWRPYFVRGYRRYCARTYGRALLYYKTEPFFSPRSVREYTHTNNWEILEIARILNQLGFVVDVVDREVPIQKFSPRSHYDVFLGLGAGNSGKHFLRLGKMVPEAVKILFAAGPEPDFSNRLIHERYEYFFSRHPGIAMEKRRLITEVDFSAFAKIADAIFYVGNDFSRASYQSFKKPLYRIYPSTSPRIQCCIDEISKSSARDFLYFGGSGNVVKGLDVLIESFADLPQRKLHICAPKEEDFERFYAGILRNSERFVWHGLVEVGSPRFHEITAECGFVVLPSCSEGCATSVVTCMRRGLIPVVTYECGIDHGDWGVSIPSIHVQDLREQMRGLQHISQAEMGWRRHETFIESWKYTQSAFSKSFAEALSRVLTLPRK